MGDPKGHERFLSCYRELQSNDETNRAGTDENETPEQTKEPEAPAEEEKDSPEIPSEPAEEKVAGEEDEEMEGHDLIFWIRLSS